MSYINVNMLAKYELSMNDYLLLQFARQQKSEDLSTIIEEVVNNGASLENLVLKEYIYSVKGLKKDSSNRKLRTTPKGNKVLEDIHTVGIEDQDVVVWDWLATTYKKEGKSLGNKNKGKFFLAQFRAQSGLEKNDLVILCEAFIADDSNMEYSHRLDYVFFKPPNVFTTRFDLEQSRLWHYYNKHKESIDNRIRRAREKRDLK